MSCYAEVVDRQVKLSCHSGWGAGEHVRLMGSTFPLIPCGQFVERLAFKAPQGLNALLFFSRVNEPQRKGSGKTTYLDHSPQLATFVVLLWEDGGKAFAKEDIHMTSPDLVRFNSFSHSGTHVTAIDAAKQTAYVVGDIKATDPEWTYKKVPGNAMAKYIAKLIRLEELDAAAEEEIHVENELAALRIENKEWLHKVRFSGQLADTYLAQASRFATNLSIFAEWTRQFLNNRFFRFACRTTIFGRRIQEVLTEATESHGLNQGKLVEAIEAARRNVPN